VLSKCLRLTLDTASDCIPVLGNSWRNVNLQGGMAGTGALMTPPLGGC